MLDPRLQAALDGPHGSRVAVAKVKRSEGYAAPPGSGPAGMKCGGGYPNGCAHCGPARGNEYAAVCKIGKKGPYGNLLYISPSSPACSKWKQRDY